ncbi:MAG: ABC transporter ATP-binding protein, partial [Verrucomicrobiales bacterium]
MIELRNLEMRFGSLVAVDRLNLDIPQGELYAFLGPNGAGKTTTIKMMTGLLAPDAGEIRIGGVDMRARPTEAKALIGFVPDVAVFYERLTVLEFLEFTADIFEVPRDRAREAASLLLERFELEACAGRRIEVLSHGMRQRLAIVAALLHEPHVLIIDEPMIGLDPIHSRRVKEELRRRSDEGMTVFMSTHLLNVAEELADRIGIIHHGRLVAEGSMEELRGASGSSREALEE